MFLLESIRELDEEQRWNPVFQMLQLDTRELVDSKTQKAARNPSNRSLNRYRDVLPYDDTRVVLETGDHDYINANVIEVPEIKRKYILTQGPMENSCSDFWQMIWENDTMAIIMLCKIVEKQVVKCHPYWPLGEDEVVQFGCFEIKNLGCEDYRHFIVRDLSVTNNSNGESRVIKQFHFITWPDFGVPEDTSSFVEFLNVLRQNNSFEPTTPPVIHCSAGIGRSGTIILVDAALKIAEQNKSPNGLDIPQLLLSMRTQRCGLIQTAQQYRFANLAIVAGLHTLFPDVFESHNNRAESDGLPPPLPEKSKTISPPQKPPRSTRPLDAHEMDIKNYKQLTGMYDEDDSGAEESEYINLSDPAFGSDGDDDDDGDGYLDSTEEKTALNQTTHGTTGNISDGRGVDTRVGSKEEDTQQQNEIGSKAREKELRQRLRKERNDASYEKINFIKQKMKDSEKQTDRSKLWLLGVAVAVTAGLYFASKWFS